MENSSVNKGNQSNRILGGLILVIGVVFFLRNLGFYVPDWLFSWHVFLIAFGLYIGFKRNFRGGGWLAMVLVGVYFTLQETILDFDVSRYYFPILFTALGLYLIFTPKSKSFLRSGRWNKRRRFDYNENSDLNENKSSLDFVDTVNVFSATQHKIFSKEFRGGDAVCVFGGCDLNFSQADFEGTIVIDVVAIFGGVKIIVPPSWQIRSELTAIFGGLEDKTKHMPSQSDGNKTVVLKGVAIFGGVEIKNY
jgi:predicted membrane protein